MLISKKLNSTIAYSACSVALLAIVGCSNSAPEQNGSAEQSPNQVASSENQPDAQNSSDTQNTPASQSNKSIQGFSGTARGKVSKVNADGSIVVLGQTISVSNTTVYFGVKRTEIEVGDYVRVESTTIEAGRVVAGSITLDTSLDPTVTLMGVVSNVNFEDETFQVGDMTVRFDAFDFANLDYANFSNGMVVEISANEQDFETGSVQINANSIIVLENGGAVVVGTNGILIGDNGETIVVDESGVTITDENGETSVTTDGITVDGIDLEDVLDDTVNDTLDTINNTLDGMLDLGDLNVHQYTDIKLSVSSNCLSVGVPSLFQITGDTENAMNEPVTHNVSSQVSIESDSPAELSLVASDDTGIFLSLSDQDIVEMNIIAGDTTLTHYIGAIPDDVARPVVLTKQTANWCSFIVFEQDTCTSITNTVSGVTATAGQTVVDTSSAGTRLSIDGEVVVDTESNQWVNDNNAADSVSSHGGLSVSGCTLSNPENIPVLTVD